jgi:hypothetical protein
VLNVVISSNEKDFFSVLLLSFRSYKKRGAVKLSDRAFVNSEVFGSTARFLHQRRFSPERIVLVAQRISSYVESDAKCDLDIFRSLENCVQVRLLV